MMIAFTDDYDTWIAKDLDDLKSLMCEEEKIIPESDFNETNWETLHDDNELTIIVDPYNNDGEKITQTIREWIKERGRGFLCSTEF